MSTNVNYRLPGGVADSILMAIYVPELLKTFAAKVLGIVVAAVRLILSTTTKWSLRYESYETIHRHFDSNT
jgi:hypothetical protein